MQRSASCTPASPTGARKIGARRRWSSLAVGFATAALGRLALHPILTRPGDPKPPPAFSATPREVLQFFLTAFSRPPHASTFVSVGHAAGNAAEEVPRNSIGFLSHLSGGEFLFPLFSYEDGLVANFDPFDS